MRQAERPPPLDDGRRAAFGLATRFFGGVSRPLGFIPLSTVDMGIAVGIVIAYRVLLNAFHSRVLFRTSTAQLKHYDRRIERACASRIHCRQSK